MTNPPSLFAHRSNIILYQSRPIAHFDFLFQNYQLRVWCDRDKTQLVIWYLKEKLQLKIVEETRKPLLYNTEIWFKSSLGKQPIVPLPVEPKPNKASPAPANPDKNKPAQTHTVPPPNPAPRRDVRDIAELS